MEYYLKYITCRGGVAELYERHGGPDIDHRDDRLYRETEEGQPDIQFVAEKGFLHAKAELLRLVAPARILS